MGIILNKELVASTSFDKMKTSIYDTKNKQMDIYDYADSRNLFLTTETIYYSVEEIERYDYSFSIIEPENFDFNSLQNEIKNNKTIVLILDWISEQIFLPLNTIDSVGIIFSDGEYEATIKANGLVYIKKKQFIDLNIVATTEYVDNAITEYVDNAIAAIPTPDVSGQIESHNVNTEAHADIRELIPTEPSDIGLSESLLLKELTVTMPSSGYWRSIAYGNGKFVAIALSVSSPYTTTDIAAYSIDGVTWIETVLPVSEDWYIVRYVNDRFIALADGSATAAYSMDGIEWVEITMPNGYFWRDIAYGGGKFVAVASQSRLFAYSTDGITWNESSLTNLLPDLWNSSIAYGNNTFVILASDSVVYAVDNGDNEPIWTSAIISSDKSWDKIVFNGEKFVIVGTNAAAYSVDGITWTETIMPSIDNYWASFTYGDGKFVAIEYNSARAAYSTDGVAWTEITMPSVRPWIPVTYGANKFVAIADKKPVVTPPPPPATVVYSTDGINWQTEYKDITSIDNVSKVEAILDILGVPTVDEMNTAISTAIGAAMEAIY